MLRGVPGRSSTARRYAAMACAPRPCWCRAVARMSYSSPLLGSVCRRMRKAASVWSGRSMASRINGAEGSRRLIDRRAWCRFDGVAPPPALGGPSRDACCRWRAASAAWPGLRAPRPRHSCAAAKAGSSSIARRLWAIAASRSPRPNSTAPDCRGPRPIGAAGDRFAVSGGRLGSPAGSAQHVAQIVVRRR